MDVCDFVPTNTLTSATFDILKMDAIDDPTINITNLANMDFEESYFVTTIRFLNEQNKEYTKLKGRLYTSIAESANEVAVLESFSDFFSAVRDIIDKFLKFMKSLFQRFINTVMQLVGSESYLMKHKKDIDDFKSGDKFTITGYKYTFNESIPSTDTGLKYDINLFDDIKNSLGALTPTVFRQATDNLDLEKEANDFRGNVIGLSESVTNSDFPDELFKVFRDNSLDKDEIDVDTSYIRIVKNRYFDYKKEKSKVEKYQKDLEKEYNRIKDEIKKLYAKDGNGLNVSAFTARMKQIPSLSGDVIFKKNATDNYDSSNNSEILSSDFLVSIDNYYKKKIDQVQEFSNIHALAFSAKLDAMKDCYKQDKAVLYQALSRIFRTDAKREN